LKGAYDVKRKVLAISLIFLFASMGWAKDGDPKRAVVGVWTMGFCKAESFLDEIPFGCTTQVMNFHEDGSVWSSFMFDQDPVRFGGLSVGAAGNWSYLGNNRFYVTMLRFTNYPSNSSVAPGNVAFLLRTDLIMEAFPMRDEAVTTKMVFMYFASEPATPYLPYRVVKKDPYQDPPDNTTPGPSGIPMKRVPSFVPDSPVLLP
jgi:hypothetical protein